MKRFRTITIATVLGLGLGLTGLTGTANAAAAIPNSANFPVVPSASNSQPCFFKQWVPTMLNGSGSWNFTLPAQQNILTQSQQSFERFYKQPQQVPERFFQQPQAPQQFYQLPQQQTPAQNSNQAKPQRSFTQPQQAPTQTANQQAASFTKQVADLVNQERAKAGLAPLQMDASLNQVAMAKASDMAQNNYFSHTSPTYGSPFDMMKQFGVSYRTAGENIAMGQRSPQEVMTQWMNSEGHRKNILNGSFTKIGVGYVNGYWVQEFAG